MDSIDLAHLERRARRVYEFQRLWRALLGVMPVLVVAAVAALFTHRPISALGFGLATVALGVAMLWYGRNPQKAVLPGVAAGLVPLVLALCANHLHACGRDVCTSVCVPACTAGGLIAGLAVANVGLRRTAGVWFWLPASSLALLTGAMGCACIGYSGVWGLSLGIGIGLVLGQARRVLRAKR